MVETYFDAYLYLANWGTHKFTLRFPCQALDLDRAQLYCAGESASARAKGEFVILDFCSQDEEGDGEEEGQGWLSSLIPLRADLASALKCYRGPCALGAWVYAAVIQHGTRN